MKTWAFVLDGHTFYVMDDVSGMTLVCDLSTQQWHHWYTGNDATVWGMLRGVTWKGRVLAVDAASSEIWELDPNSALDRSTEHIRRVVTAFQSVRGKGSIRQGSFRITASMGEPSLPDAVVSMRFSDDEGQSWSPTYERTVQAGNFGQLLRYRSLGRIRAPGRIWEVSDTGGLLTIEGADVDVEGQ